MDLLMIAVLFLPGLVGVYWLGRIVGFEHGAAWRGLRDRDLATTPRRGSQGAEDVGDGLYRPIAGAIDVPDYVDPDYVADRTGELEEMEADAEEEARIEQVADAAFEEERNRLLSEDMVDHLFEGKDA